MTKSVLVAPALTLEEGRALARFLGRITMGELCNYSLVTTPAIHKTYQAVCEAVREAEELE